MANGWTLERRARQAEAIRRWKPWERSTGPRTPDGKAKSQRNGSQPGTRALLREVSKLLREQRKSLDDWSGY
jgi:hypothetical protein